MTSSRFTGGLLLRTVSLLNGAAAERLAGHVIRLREVPLWALELAVEELDDRAAHVLGLVDERPVRGCVREPGTSACGNASRWRSACATRQVWVACGPTARAPAGRAARSAPRELAFRRRPRPALSGRGRAPPAAWRGRSRRTCGRRRRAGAACAGRGEAGAGIPARVVVAMNSSPSSGVRQTRASACQRVAGQRAGAEQHRRREALRVRRRPRRRPHGPPKSCSDEVRPVDPERGERPGDELGVRVDGLHEARRRHARPRSPARPTRRLAVPRAPDGGDQLAPSRRPEPGLPCRNTTASRSSAGPACAAAASRRRQHASDARIWRACRGRGAAQARGSRRARAPEQGRSAARRCIVDHAREGARPQWRRAPGYGMQAAAGRR